MSMFGIGTLEQEIWDIVDYRDTKESIQAIIRVLDILAGRIEHIALDAKPEDAA